MTDDDDNDKDDDHLLELAIRYKDEGDLRRCAEMHKLRMMRSERLTKMDAVRLLDDANHNVGIFDVCRYNVNRFKPTNRGLELGLEARNVFVKYGYKLSIACSYLMEALGCDESQKYGRIFTGNSFFNNRGKVLDMQDLHEVKLSSDNKCYGLSGGLILLIHLFLCGLAVEREALSKEIDKTSVDILVAAGLSRINQVNDRVLLTRIQIYPLSLFDLFPWLDNDSRPESLNHYLF